MRVAVLGHNGLLGNTVHKFFEFLNFEVITFNDRWPSPGFKESLKNMSVDVVINCIGNIPQRGRHEDYESLNYELPLWLDRNSTAKVIHPTTDCEFKGNGDPTYRYSLMDKRDAHDLYGKSKAKLSEALEQHSRRTKVIRTSIIGLENTSSVSLLSWFLAQSGPVDGFTSHYWNGITTLEWSKQSLQLILDWDSRPLVNQIGTRKAYSKYEMLLLFKTIFSKNIDVNKKNTAVVNKTLEPSIPAKDLPHQLRELKFFLGLFNGLQNNA